jgi:Ca2+-transporting ATPase
MALHPVDAKTGNGRHGLSRRPDDRENAPTPFHAQAVEVCLQLLQTSLQGLSDAEAAIRQKQQGHKGIDTRETSLAPQIFLNSLKKYISLLFIATAGLSFYMGHVTDGLMIIVALLLNIGIQGLIQWKSLHKQTFTVPTDAIRCQVRRDGQTHRINASELVPGDILIIEGGLLMPADARLISSYQMQVDESSLTGESVLVPKNANEVLHPMEDVTAQANMLFAGTLVKTGKGEAVVTALGSHTVMGRIASVASKTRKRQSPFTKRLNALSLKIFGVALVLTAIVIAVGLARHMPLPLLLQVALVMGIAAFPETIPSLASLIMSLGINRLNDKKVLVKSFQALETIGDLTVVCTDKTGTLTENYLTFDQLFLPGLGAVAYNPEWQRGENIPCKSVEEFLRIGRLNNGTVLEGLRSAIMGDPIDVALYRAAPAALDAGYKHNLKLTFFDSTHRFATNF